MAVNEKRENFKFSKRTADNLTALIEMGLARNKTEAVDIALEHIVTEEKTKRSVLHELRIKGMIENAPTGPLTQIRDLLSVCGEERTAAQGLV